MSVSAAGWVAAIAVMALGACVQGAVGFGAALVSAPLLALISVDFVPVPITLATTTLNVLLVRLVRDSDDVDHRIRWAEAGVVPGAIAAGAALAVLSARGLSIAFAVIVLIGVVLSISGIHVERTPRTLLAAGTLSGFMGTVSSIGGPPIELLYQRERAAVLRGTLPRYFLFASVIAIAVFVAVGKLGLSDLVAGVALLPGIFIGLRLAPWLSFHVDRTTARPAVLALSTLAAVAVLVKEVA